MSISFYDNAMSTISNDTIGVSRTAISLQGVPEDATMALIGIESSPVRFWTSGGIPTTTEGFKVEPGYSIQLDSIEKINSFKIISTTQTDARIQIQYYK